MTEHHETTGEQHQHVSRVRICRTNSVFKLLCLLFLGSGDRGGGGGIMPMSQLISKPAGGRRSNSHHSEPAGITSDSSSGALS